MCIISLWRFKFGGWGVWGLFALGAHHFRSLRCHLCPGVRLRHGRPHGAHERTQCCGTGQSMFFFLCFASSPFLIFLTLLLLLLLLLVLCCVVLCCVVLCCVVLCCVVLCCVVLCCVVLCCVVLCCVVLCCVVLCCVVLCCVVLCCVVLCCVVLCCVVLCCVVLCCVVLCCVVLCCVVLCCVVLCCVVLCCVVLCCVVLCCVVLCCVVLCCVVLCCVVFVCLFVCLLLLLLLLLPHHIPKRDAPCLDGNEAESNGMNTTHPKTGLFRLALCSTIEDAFLVFCDSTRRGGFCQALFVAPKELRWCWFSWPQLHGHGGSTDKELCIGTWILSLSGM